MSTAVSLSRTRERTGGVSVSRPSRTLDSGPNWLRLFSMRLYYGQQASEIVLAHCKFSQSELRWLDQSETRTVSEIRPIRGELENRKYANSNDTKYLTHT